MRCHALLLLVAIAALIVACADDPAERTSSAQPKQTADEVPGNRSVGGAEPLDSRPSAAPGNCQAETGRPGPARAPEPFLCQPFAGTFDPEVWTAQMDHDRPDYHQNGVVAALGESLRYDLQGPGLAGGTQAYQVAGTQWFDRDVPYTTLVDQGYTILAYQSPSFESYLYYDGHDGHDFAVTGQALAAADGVIAFKGDYGDGLGQVIEIYHLNGYLTRYAHLASFDAGLQVGSTVKAGERVGQIGGSAIVGGNLVQNHWGVHLHFSVFRWNGSRWQVTDPFGWDPWAGPDQKARDRRQREDPLQDCNGEVSYDLWLGGWPQSCDATGEGNPVQPALDRYVGGWLGVEPEPQAEPASASIPLAIHGFNYTFTDAGDGWNEATLQLGFEDTGDLPLAPTCLVFDRDRADFGGWLAGCPADSIELAEAFVETLEGKTYPAEIAPPAIKVGDPQVGLPLLPGVPFRHVTVMMGYVWDTATFRFATAAHPVTLVLKGSTEFRIDLTHVPKALPEPDLSQYALRSVAELVNEPLLKEEGKVQAAFEGTCAHTYMPSFYTTGIDLPYTVTNTDALDEASYELKLRYAAYYPSGLLTYRINYPGSPYTIGPGQVESLSTLLFDEHVDPDNDAIVEEEDLVRASLFFVFPEAGSINVYRLACPDQ